MIRKRNEKKCIFCTVSIHLLSTLWNFPKYKNKLRGPLNLLLMQAVKGRLSLLIVVSNTNTARNNTIIHNLKSKNKYNFFIASKVKYIEVNVCYISNELGGTLWTYHSLSLPYCLFLYSMFLIYQIFTRLFQSTKSSDFQNPATSDFAHTQIFLESTPYHLVSLKS